MNLPDEAATATLGAWLARQLKGGDVVALSGISAQEKPDLSGTCWPLLVMKAKFRARVSQLSNPMIT